MLLQEIRLPSLAAETTTVARQSVECELDRTTGLAIDSADILQWSVIEEAGKTTSEPINLLTVT